MSIQSKTLCSHKRCVIDVIDVFSHAV
jgi:hypothetical protein